MSDEELAFYFRLFSALAALLALLCLAHRKRRTSEIDDEIDAFHGGDFMLSVVRAPQVSAVAVVLYAIVAVTGNEAITWLASVALAAYFAGLLADRLLTARATARKRKTLNDEDFEPSPPGKGDVRELAPEVLSVLVLLADIVVIAAFADLAILVGLEIADVAVPGLLGRIGLL